MWLLVWVLLVVEQIMELVLGADWVRFDSLHLEAQEVMRVLLEWVLVACLVDWELLWATLMLQVVFGASGCRCHGDWRLSCGVGVRRLLV